MKYKVKKGLMSIVMSFVLVVSVFAGAVPIAALPRNEKLRYV